MNPPAHVRERFWSKVEPGDGECWNWTGHTRGNGYGSFNIYHGKLIFAHRLAYEMLVADIPDGLTIDHLCRNIICVNPYHMEPIPRGLNRQRAAAVVTHCPRGHEYTSANTAIYNNCRTCRMCGRLRMKERRANLRASVAQEL